MVGNCIKSLYEFNDIGDELEIIVVDNSPSGDPTYDYIRVNFPKVTLVRNELNGGFGQGNNLGVKHSNGQYIAFINPDIIFIEPLFRTAINEFINHQSTEVIGFLLQDLSGRNVMSYEFLPECITIYSHAYFYIPLIKYAKLSLKNIYPCGADMFITKQAFLNAGGFDENYFLNYEEADLIRRLKKRNVKILNKKIIHLIGHSKTILSENIDNYLKSERYYFKKYCLDYVAYRKMFIRKIKLFRIIKTIFFKKLSVWERLLEERYTQEIYSIRTHEYENP